MQPQNIPQHLGIIIDGNRRWAVENGISKLEGHRHGAENLKKLLPAIIARGIPVVSVYTFSTENWRRAAEEVNTLMALIAEVFRDYFEWFHEQGAKVRISGRVEDFPPEIQEIFSRAIEGTEDNTKIIVNFCLSYGGREEILQAAKRLAAATRGDVGVLENAEKAEFEKHLYTAGLPDVDLVIRTGGVRRLSGFLPWQSTYAELYFTETLWPDFDEKELDKALEYFAGVKRNFGV